MNYWRDALISGAAPHFAALIAISFISSWVSFRREIIIITTSLRVVLYGIFVRGLPREIIQFQINCMILIQNPLVHFIRNRTNFVRKQYRSTFELYNFVSNCMILKDFWKIQWAENHTVRILRFFESPAGKKKKWNHTVRKKENCT